VHIAQAAVGKFVETFKKFPAVQKPNTFTIHDAMAKISDVTGAGH
jgi:arylsulfatase